jgi:pantoate--beta-alanine ligase
MIVARTVAEARAWAAARRAAGRRIALVPTMGALHAGHLSLAAAGGRGGAAVAMSIFVNPTQFGAGEDFERYPRDLDRDLRLAAEAGVEMVFAPEVAEMYPGGAEVLVEVGRVGAVLEGALRPTHFRGVATVVTKLLHACAPDVAVFGQKDAQQVVVIRHLVRALLLPVEILCAPTVREPDGLAMSSRNAYLDGAERRVAPALHAALAEGEAAIRAGERRAAEVCARIRGALARRVQAPPDYVAAASAEDLSPLETLGGKVLLLVALRLGRTRLLDNACLDIDGGEVRPALP